MPCGYCVFFSDWFSLRNSLILINFMQECAAYFFYILLVCQETLPTLENVENISGQKPTTLAKKVETAENHDVERTLFDALHHECRANIVFRGCALGAGHSWSSTVSHDRTASYRHHDSRPSHFFFFFGKGSKPSAPPPPPPKKKKKPDKSRLEPYGTKSPSQSEALCFINSAKSPSTCTKKGSLVDLGGGFPIDTEDHGGCWWWTNKNRMVRAQASPGFFTALGFWAFV